MIIHAVLISALRLFAEPILGLWHDVLATKAGAVHPCRLPIMLLLRLLSFLVSYPSMALCIPLQILADALYLSCAIESNSDFSRLRMRAIAMMVPRVMLDLNFLMGSSYRVDKRWCPSRKCFVEIVRLHADQVSGNQVELGRLELTDIPYVVFDKIDGDGISFTRGSGSPEITLSYRWGEEFADVSGHRISKNLIKLLMDKRGSLMGRRVWVDCLCIDDVEKAFLYMGKLYLNTLTVTNLPNDLEMFKRGWIYQESAFGRMEFKRTSNSEFKDLFLNRYQGWTPDSIRFLEAYNSLDFSVDSDRYRAMTGVMSVLVGDVEKYCGSSQIDQIWASSGESKSKSCCSLHDGPRMLPCYPSIKITKVNAGTDKLHVEGARFTLRASRKWLGAEAQLVAEDGHMIAVLQPGIYAVVKSNHVLAFITGGAPEVGSDVHWVQVNGIVDFRTYKQALMDKGPSLTDHGISMLQSRLKFKSGWVMDYFLSSPCEEWKLVLGAVLSGRRAVDWCKLGSPGLVDDG